jgi:DNA repair photolyase
MLSLTEKTAKSILNKSKVFDYCLNPYTGCSHRCRYCYAALFMPRYSGHSEPRGQWVEAKTNAPDLLRRQLVRARPGTIWIASVCDAYQPAEVKYQLTRKCLAEISRFDFPVFIQTKSDLVLRDLDLLQNLKEAEIGFSIATDSDRVASLFEPGAPSISRRLKALEKIKKSNFRTFAFVGPILPQDPVRLISLLGGLVDKLFIVRLNYRGYFIKFYRQHGLEAYAADNYFDQIKAELKAASQKYDFELEEVF